MSDTQVPNVLRGIVSYDISVDLNPYSGPNSLSRQTDQRLGRTWLIRITVSYVNERGITTPDRANINVFRMHGTGKCVAEANGTNSAAGWQLSEQEIDAVYPLAKDTFEELFRGLEFPESFSDPELPRTEDTA